MNYLSAESVADTLAKMLDKPVEHYASYQSATILMDFAEQLFKYRDDRHMNQSQLAAELGISQPMVSQYESGSSNITIGRLCEICEQIGLVFHGRFVPAASPSSVQLTDISPFIDAA